jgi:hypothetical protein
MQNPADTRATGCRTLLIHEQQDAEPCWYTRNRMQNPADTRATGCRTLLIHVQQDAEPCWYTRNRMQNPSIKIVKECWWHGNSVSGTLRDIEEATKRQLNVLVQWCNSPPSRWVAWSSAPGTGLPRTRCRGGGQDTIGTVQMQTSHGEWLALRPLYAGGSTSPMWYISSKGLPAIWSRNIFRYK